MIMQKLPQHLFRLSTALNVLASYMRSLTSSVLLAVKVIWSGVADALADLVYVALGTAYKMGLPFDSIWQAVQAANMRKVAGPTKRGNKVDACKPEGWVGPETAIARAIQRKVDHG